MTNEKFGRIRQEIDALRLSGQWAVPINLSLGPHIYQAFKDRGLLPEEQFGNPADQNEPILHEAYAGNVWVIKSDALEPCEYLFGKGGDF